MALALAGAAALALELRVRDHGYRPSVADDPFLWAQQRARMSDGDPYRIALVGDSRIQLGVSTRRLRAELPRYEVAQLAIEGSNALATLRDLAADDRFRGVAIVNVTADRLRHPDARDGRGYIARFHDRWRAPGAVLNRYLATWFQHRVTLLYAGGRRMLRMLARDGTLPPPIYIVTNPDRSRDADYSLTDLSARRERQRKRLAGRSKTKGDPEAWLRAARRVEPLVTRLHARGARVVFLRMPTCYEHWEHTEKTMPKAEFWDRFAAETGAVTIHFRDYPSLSDFDCPDASHLDQRDAPRFTSALVEILIERGVVERP